MKQILEIGPELEPLHHRRGGAAIDSGHLHLLEEGEKYTGIERYDFDFNSRIWETLRETYGERVKYLHASSNSRESTQLPFEANYFDELVALGCRFLDPYECRRVLKVGGILRIGTGAPGEEGLMGKLGPRLEQIGFELLPEHTQRYRRTNPGYAGGYVVLVFQKKELSEEPVKPAPPRTGFAQFLENIQRRLGFGS